MPSWELFEHQDRGVPGERPAAAVTARVAVEQASPSAGRYTSASTATIIGMKTFGASAPLKELQKKFGFTPDNVVTAARSALRKHQTKLRGRTRTAGRAPVVEQRVVPRRRR